jgi:uncharacterized membrane protein
VKFPWQKRSDFFDEAQKAQIIAAIQAAEQRTSGEVRVYIEDRCRYMDALDRAREVFAGLSMHATEERNATLVYIAVKDKQAAVYGDEGIHRKVSKQYWEETVARMLAYFKNGSLADGISSAVTDLGEALHQHFPYNNNTDKNELPDNIVFGR